VEPSFGIGIVCLATDAGVFPEWCVFSKSGAAAEELHEVLRLGQPSFWWYFEAMCTAATPAEPAEAEEASVGSEVDVNAPVDEEVHGDSGSGPVDEFQHQV